MQRILTIIGARPQFIKASVVSRAIQQAEGIEEIMLQLASILMPICRIFFSTNLIFHGRMFS